MRRREIIAAAAPTILWPLRARSQQAALPVIGYLGTGSPEAFAPMLPAFQAGLKESGYVEGRNVVLTHRWADGRYERLPALAAELVTLKVAVILAPTGLAAITAKKATQSIPIVFLSGDAVALGLVASLSRPGGNATGVSILVPELIPKRLELLRELFRGPARLRCSSTPERRSRPTRWPTCSPRRVPLDTT